MEKPRTAVQKVAKMKELGIFDKWVYLTPIRELRISKIRILLSRN